MVLFVVSPEHYLQSAVLTSNQGGPGMVALGLIWPVLHEELLLHQEEKVIDF